MSAQIANHTAIAETAKTILSRAAERGAVKALPYAGEVTPEEAHSLLRLGKAKVVDIRSRFEHEFIGRIPDARLVEWRHWPSGEANPKFLEQLSSVFDKDEVLLMLCRSGVRSHGAAQAAAAAGYAQAYNILEGFEGDLDAEHHRGKLGGWRKRGLPWVQS